MKEAIVHLEKTNKKAWDKIESTLKDIMHEIDELIELSPDKTYTFSARTFEMKYSNFLSMSHDFLYAAMASTLSYNAKKNNLSRVGRYVFSKSEEAYTEDELFDHFHYKMYDIYPDLKREMIKLLDGCSLEQKLSVASFLSWFTGIKFRRVELTTASIHRIACWPGLLEWLLTTLADNGYIVIVTLNNVSARRAKHNIYLQATDKLLSLAVDYELDEVEYVSDEGVRHKRSEEVPVKRLDTFYDIKYIIETYPVSALEKMQAQAEPGPQSVEAQLQVLNDAEVKQLDSDTYTVQVPMIDFETADINEINTYISSLKEDYELSQQRVREQQKELDRKMNMLLSSMQKRNEEIDRENEDSQQRLLKALDETSDVKQEIKLLKDELFKANSKIKAYKKYDEELYQRTQIQMTQLVGKVMTLLEDFMNAKRYERKEYAINDTKVRALQIVQETVNEIMKFRPDDRVPEEIK